ncbi:Uncharacterised protein [Vibrio cholerae]|uniref:Uncharacterized protein n=1 Tax=Vibrio cholerae TaxID=666 RepID=A0A655YII8_VIBCL|nr:Uncharacterised protein [Vibrio cholerae]CSA94227.1 Uncharacterised protein [Vibrio cholerae]CSA94525.1 Uncharacterised protein [Vibrio cholerae]CSA96263.1 Uncharacterised protein [Vibrio cholerae]CSB72037.1 Uncharacterised protein [Vibrio cholerae]
MLQITAHFETVDNYFNGMLFVQFEFRWIGQIAGFTIDTRTNKALRSKVFQCFNVFAFALFDYGCQQHHFAAFWQFQYFVYHLTDGLRFQWHLVFGAAWLTNPSVE